jgi:hypothetical protein
MYNIPTYHGSYALLSAVEQNARMQSIPLYVSNSSIRVMVHNLVYKTKKW